MGVLSMKVKQLISMLIVVSASGLAMAAPSSQHAWTVDQYRALKGGDAAAGQQLETVETDNSNPCTDCHGKAGAEPDRDKQPVLAAQVAAYTYKQLKDYQTGDRDSRKMQRAVEELSDQQLADLSAWYAAQPIPKVEVDEDENFSDATVELVFKGDKKRMIQPCAACHGSKGEGAAIDVPAITGQNVRYFKDTMKEYAKGRRTNDVYSRMRIIAAQLTRDEIEELAVYYAKLGNELAGGGDKQASAE